MKKGKEFLDVHVAKIDGRYPNIKREFPNATHIGFGTKFEGGLPTVEQWAKNQPEYKRRKYPPKIRIIEI